MVLTAPVLDPPAVALAEPIIRTRRRLAVTARNVDHQHRLAKTGQAPKQGADQIPPLLQRHAQMRRAGGEIGVVEVIGLDSILDEGAHKSGQGLDLVVDAAQQNGLADQDDP